MAEHKFEIQKNENDNLKVTYTIPDVNQPFEEFATVLISFILSEINTAAANLESDLTLKFTTNEDIQSLISNFNSEYKVNFLEGSNKPCLSLSLKEKFFCTKVYQEFLQPLKNGGIAIDASADGVQIGDIILKFTW